MLKCSALSRAWKPARPAQRPFCERTCSDRAACLLARRPSDTIKQASVPSVLLSGRWCRFRPAGSVPGGHQLAVIDHAFVGGGHLLLGDAQVELANLLVQC